MALSLLQRIRDKTLGIANSTLQSAGRIAGNQTLNNAAQGFNNIRNTASDILVNHPQRQREAQADFTNQIVRPYVRNRYIDPVTNIPNATRQVVTPGQRLQGGAGLLSGYATLLPDPIGDVALPIFDAYKGYSSAKVQGMNNLDALENARQSFVGEKYVGLGDAITTDETAQTAGNVAELPLLLMAGGMRGKTADDGVESVSRAVKSGNISVDEGKALLNLFKKDLGNVKRTVDILDETSKSKKTSDLIDSAGNFKRNSLKDTVPEISDVNWYQKIVLPRSKRLEKSLPEPLYKTVKNRVIDPLNKDLGNSVTWKKSYIDRIQNLNIKPGGTEDKLIREYVSGDITKKALEVNYGKDTADRVVAASKELRKSYDEIFKFVNKARKSAGLPEVKKKKNFLSQVSNRKPGSTDSLENMLQGGVSAEKSRALFRRQKGEATTGAVESFLSYLDVARQGAFVDPHAARMEKYAKSIRKNASKYGGDKKAIEYLNDYANTLFGRKEYGGLEGAVERVTRPLRSSAVVGNPSSIFAQIFNLPQGAVESGPKNFIKSLYSSDAEKAANSSPYLKAIDEKMPINLVQGKLAKTYKVGAIPLQEANNFTAKTLWKAFYEQGKKSGVDDLIQFADDAVVELMGDRRLGAASSFYGSPIGRVFGAFTLENQAAINKLVENIGEKKAGKVLGTLLVWHLANGANEKFGTGYRPFFDPIEGAKEAYEQFVGSERKEPNTVKSVGRIVAELTNLSPSTQSIIFSLYGLGNQLDVLPDSEDVFGTEDPTWQNVGGLYNPFDKVGRNVTGNDLVDEPLNIASKVLPFANPVARSTQSLFSLNRGNVKSRSGNTMFETPTSPLDIVRSVLFGQYSTPQAREFFDSDYSRPLTEKQTKIYDTLPKDGRTNYLDKVQKDNRNKSIVDSYTKEDEGFLSKLFNKEKELPEGDALKQEHFDGLDMQTAKSNTEKADIYKELSSVLNNKDLPDEYKQKVLEASGATQESVDYYQKTKTSYLDRREELVQLANKDYEDRSDLLLELALNKRTVAGSSVSSNQDFDYLYDMGYITKDEKKLLNAIKFDETTNEFYVDRDFKDDVESGGLTASQKKALVNKINNIFKASAPKRRELPDTITKIINNASKPPQLFSNTSSRSASSNRTSDRWFRSY